MSGYRTTVRKPCNHVLHLILTLITLGLWAPVWIVVAIVGKRETVVTRYPTQGGPGWSQQTGYVTPETGHHLSHPYPPASQHRDGYYNPYTQTWMCR